MIHTFFYQTVEFVGHTTTYRKAVSALPQVPDAVYETGGPLNGWEVREVRYDLDKDEMHVVIDDRVIEPLDDPQGDFRTLGEIDVMMQASGWQRAPRDRRFCVEVELDLPTLPHVPMKVK